MNTITLDDKDLRTVAKILAEKAVEMHKKGSVWGRNIGKKDEDKLTCVGMGKLANKILEPLDIKYNFDSFFSGKQKSKRKQSPKK